MPDPWFSRSRLWPLLLIVVMLPPAMTAQTNLLSGTNVLLSNSGSSTSSSTHIFSPATYVDYKRFGGEPTITVDRYPFPGFNTSAAAACPNGATSCFKDISYASSPNGFVFPHYSVFWKSSDLGRTFRVPEHIPVFGETILNSGGGGDSFQVVGTVTHNVFFVDLPGPGCVTMNRSTDLGESWTSNPLGCGLNPGAIDDRQWTDADETFPGSQNAYVSFINFTNLTAVTLSLARSTDDGVTFAGPCNTLTDQTSAVAATDSTPTVCPDPMDPALQVGGPVVADKSSASPHQHRLYIPFIRGGPPFDVMVAISTDGANTWTRHLVAHLGLHNPQNLFSELTLDSAGNLYYVWSQTQGPGVDSSGALIGEQDVFYSVSQDGGATWSAPFNLTPETGDSAIMPWAAAGDSGRLDVVFYKANTGQNSNDATNPSIWNVFLAQSVNALSATPNFKTMQISNRPNHVGQICTSGLNCNILGGNRNLLDFFTVDVDHLGAAEVLWADDNNAFNETRNLLSRQLSGPGVFANQTINLVNSWGISKNAASDFAGDVFDGQGIAKGACPGMDLLNTSASLSGTLLTISLTLNAAPTNAAATACSTNLAATGGIWGAEFWAVRADNSTDNFYIAYRDNPLDGAPRVEAGTVNALNATVTTAEFSPSIAGTLGGNCFPLGAPASGTCTVSVTIDSSQLNLRLKQGLHSVTGLSAYLFGTASKPPLLNIEGGDSEQADADTSFDVMP